MVYVHLSMKPLEVSLRRLSLPEVLSSCRRWTGNDQKGRFRHSGTVPLRKSPLDLELHWRESEKSSSRLIGAFRLDLPALLSQGLIRIDPKPGHVRVQFVHKDDGIYLRHLGEGLRVGDFI